MELRKKAESMIAEIQSEIDEALEFLDYEENREYIDILFVKKHVLEELLDEWFNRWGIRL